MDFTSLKKNLKRDYSGFKPFKLALLGDSSMQLVAQSLRAYGYEVHLNLEIFEADYQQIDQLIFDFSSELYLFQPDFVVIFHCTENLQKRFYKTKSGDRANFASDQITRFRDMWEAIGTGLPSAKIIFSNFQEIDDGIFGNFANKTKDSLLHQIRSLNFHLMEVAAGYHNLFINDISSLQNQYGRQWTVDAKIYINADMVFSLDFLPHVAKNTVDVLQATTGFFKKALILDLDNTIWGGTIGDDGMENIQIGELGIGKAFTELQLWARELGHRGIILAICSKNDEKIAREPFEKHPDMILRLDDIAVFVANWESKVDNIKSIQETLNIGFDSMVFLDDNPFERNIVRTHLPLVSVPELPEDPVEYMPYIRTLNLFETASYTQDDSKRTKQYQEESSRVKAQKTYTSEDEFLKSLDMTADISAFDNFNIPRIAQLSQRSNQFNLRTIRYTDGDVRQVSNDPNYFPLAISLKDKFGQYGLISIVILQKNPISAQKELFIDTWLMSCRVLRRGVENLVLNKLVEIAKENGFIRLVGEYLPTPKNELVKDHYKNLGFTNHMDHWILNVDDYIGRLHYIQ